MYFVSPIFESSHAGLQVRFCGHPAKIFGQVDILSKILKPYNSIFFWVQANIGSGRIRVRVNVNFVMSAGGYFYSSIVQYKLC